MIVAWLARADRLAVRRFLLWNALGGVTWAASIAGRPRVIHASLAIIVT